MCVDNCYVQPVQSYTSNNYSRPFLLMLDTVQARSSMGYCLLPGETVLARVAGGGSYIGYGREHWEAS